MSAGGVEPATPVEAVRFGVRVRDPAMGRFLLQQLMALGAILLFPGTLFLALLAVRGQDSMGYGTAILFVAAAGSPLRSGPSSCRR